MKRIFYLLLFVGAVLFYWGIGEHIQNRTEAEDVYEYALMVEQGAEHLWYYHQHHLLFGPAVRGIYRLSQALGYDGRAIYVMRGVSAFAAAGTLLFFFLFCYKRFSLRPISSLLSTVFLGVSYGFWRYAAESEIPLVASFFMTAALYFGTDIKRRRSFFLISLLFSSVAVLVHVMNAVAVFAAMPFFYLLRRRWVAVGVHLLVCGAVVTSVYAAVGAHAVVHSSGGAHLSMLSLGALVKGGMAFFQSLVSCNFMLGFISVRAFLEELFFGRMLLEEFYLGVRLSRPLVLFSTLSFLSVLGLSIACLLRSGWVWMNMKDEQGHFKLPEGFASIGVALIWFLGYGGLLLLVEPGNPELWVMGIVPFALLLCGLVMLPLTYDNRLWLPFLMVVMLFVHNGVGGIGVLKNRESDYQYRKSQVLLNLAGSDDVVVTAGNPVFERYLRYHFEGKVVYLYDLTAEELKRAVLPEPRGNIYVLDDVFNQPRSLTVRFSERSACIAEFATKILPHVHRVADDEFGGVWEWNDGQ
jgi:hypothetical protein